MSSSLKRIYLSIYNWTVFYGWLQVLYLALKTLNESGYEKVYDAVERPLQLAQTAAVLEILHGLVGLVRSPISATLPQIGSRLYVTWGILWSFPETQKLVLVSFLVISWSITEIAKNLKLDHFQEKKDVKTLIPLAHAVSSVGSLGETTNQLMNGFMELYSFPSRHPIQIIRYSFFGMKEALGFAPSWLLWLRYSTFLILYPTGITSEVSLIYKALPYMKASDLYCVRMPNKWNFSFDYFYASILVVGIYVPGSPYLYQYMLGQRKKALSKSKRE